MRLDLEEFGSRLQRATDPDPAPGTDGIPENNMLCNLKAFVPKCGVSILKKSSSPPSYRK